MRSDRFTFQVRRGATMAAIGVLAGAAFAGAALPAAALGAANTPKITSVAFTGSSKAPVITIKGTGFGTSPKPNPPGSPALIGAGCRSQPPRGNDGHDYGPTALGMSWAVSAPSGYMAGVYVPGRYLDCIGLIIQKYTATSITMKPGGQYFYYRPVTLGDKYQVEVGGATFKGTVVFT